MFYSPSFDNLIERIDQLNSEDPNIEIHEGIALPKEFLYAQRMTDELQKFEPQASEELFIAARAQHICRWKIPRDQYPETRQGYLQWRNALKIFHGELTKEIMLQSGYNELMANRVAFLIEKKNLKSDPETQTLEDVICLVFLRYYASDFAKKHPLEKVEEILSKTWRKMSKKGCESALQIEGSPELIKLLQKIVT